MGSSSACVAWSFGEATFFGVPNSFGAGDCCWSWSSLDGVVGVSVYWPRSDSESCFGMADLSMASSLSVKSVRDCTRRGDALLNLDGDVGAVDVFFCRFIWKPMD